MAARVCSCASPSTALVEGVLVCEKCGERVRDTHEERRDRAIALTARAVASIDRRLAGASTSGAAPESNGSSPRRDDLPTGTGVPNVPRFALKRLEAAHSIGVGLTYFKTKVAPQLRVIRKGGVRLYPVAELERWVEENAEPAIVEQLEEGKS